MIRSNFGKWIENLLQMAIDNTEIASEVSLVSPFEGVTSSWAVQWLKVMVDPHLTLGDMDGAVPSEVHFQVWIFGPTASPEEFEYQTDPSISGTLLNEISKLRGEGIEFDPWVMGELESPNAEMSRWVAVTKASVPGYAGTVFE